MQSQLTGYQWQQRRHIRRREAPCRFYNDTNSFYYHNPEITDWEDEYQLSIMRRAAWRLSMSRISSSGNTSKAIKACIDIGVDALRLDTIKHMPLWFW
jgi:cyclomaltodextrin glucanotransferase